MFHHAELQLAQLAAVQSTYKGACRKYGVPQDKCFVSQVEEAIHAVTSIDKV
jgi:hypothetical protein